MLSNNIKTNTNNINALKNKFLHKTITSGDMNALGSSIAWLNGYGSISNNPFANIHSMIVTQGGETDVNNQLVINTNGEMVFRHSDNGKDNFTEWTHCCAPTISGTSDGRWFSKSGKMVTLCYPSSIHNLSSSGTFPKLPTGYNPVHPIKTQCKTMSSNSYTGDMSILIEPGGNISYISTATGNQEVCFTVSYLTN